MMLIWHKSETGSICERHQESWYFDEQAGLLVLADGDGPIGRDLADAAMTAFSRKVRLIYADTNLLKSNPLHKLMNDVIRETESIRASSPGGGASRINLAAVLIHDGLLSASVVGKIGLSIKASGKIYKLESHYIPKLGSVTGELDEFHTARKSFLSSLWSDSEDRGWPIVLNSLPVTVGDWVLMASQGILVSQPLDEMQPIFTLAEENPETALEAFFTKASGRYDGDDRTLVLARILPIDLNTRYCGDAVISIDFDRKLKMPMWAVLLFAAVCAVFAAFINVVFTRRFR